MSIAAACTQKAVHFWLWFVLNLIVPLVAIGMVKFAHRVQGRSMPLSKIISDGQACFYAVAVMGASLSEILPKASESAPPDSIFVVPLIFMMAFAGLAFATMNADHHNPTATAFDYDFCRNVSIFFVIAAIILSSIVHYC